MLSASLVGTGQCVGNLPNVAVVDKLMNTRPQKIRTFTGLNELLADEYIVFCGSAISGFPVNVHGSSKRFLPMVDDVTHEIFRLFDARFCSGSYQERLLANYSRLMADHGNYKAIRLSTKFEAFLWYLEKNLGKGSLRQLVRALFLCDGGQFGLPHSAVGALFKSGRVNLCLTTNFDNALENSLDGIRRFIHGDKLPKTFPNPTLVKLHGDVKKGRIITTTPALARANRLVEFRYLDDLLAGKRVVFIGYSGVGDIDISPVLASLKDRSTMIWMVRNGGRPPSLATHWFESDLFSIEKKKNWLLWLAADASGDTVDISPSPPDWESRLRNWMDELDSGKAFQILQDIFSRGNGWSFLHQFHASRQLWGRSTPLTYSAQEAADLGFACLQVTAYHTAMRAFTCALTRAKDQKLWANVVKWIGFCYWRLGRLDDALAILRSLIDSEGIKKRSREHYFDSMLYFIEVATEKLRYVPFPRRQALYHELRIPKYSALMLRQGSADPGTNLLYKLKIEAIRLLLRETSDLRQISEIYEQLIALQEWGLAEAAARIWVEYDRAGGARALLNVDRKLLERRNWNTIRKSIAAFLESFGFLKTVRPIHVLDGPAFAGQKASWVEWRYAIRLAKWRRAFLADRVIAP